MSLRWTLDGSPDHRRLALSGAITESADFARMIEPGTGAALSIDLSDVTLINSCGVREWTRFVATLAPLGRRVTFVRCSPAIVRQLNLISNFCGTGTVRSVLLPYYCDACGAEQQRLLQLDDGEDTIVEESIDCSSCSGQADFDDIVDRYLAFATRS